MRETETLDRLYLEISQFTTAKTAREIALERVLREHHDWHLSMTDLNEHGFSPAEAYVESEMCDRTLTALSASDKTKEAR